MIFWVVPLKTPDHICEVISRVGILVSFCFPIHGQGVIVIPAIIPVIMIIIPALEQLTFKDDLELPARPVHHHRDYHPKSRNV